MINASIYWYKEHMGKCYIVYYYTLYDSLMKNTSNILYLYIFNYNLFTDISYMLFFIFI